MENNILLEMINYELISHGFVCIIDTFPKNVQEFIRVHNIALFSQIA